MAYTGNAVNIDEVSAYRQSFGSMANKTVYQKADPMSLASGLPKYDNDMRPQLNEAFESGRTATMKAHTTTSGGAGTAGYALIPVYVDPKIVDQSRKYTPLCELIPRVTNQGMYADYNVITAKGGAFTAAEDAALSETNTTYDRQSEPIKFLYAVGRVTGPSQAAQPSYILMGMNPQGGATGPFSDASAPNATQQEVLVKARELKELEELLIVRGSSTTSVGSGAAGTEFNGLITQIGTTNTVDKNSTAVTLDDVSTAIQNAFDDGGRPNLGIASSAAFTDLLKLISAKIGYMQSVVQVQWGFSAIVLNTMVGQIPVLPSMFMVNTANLKSIYFIDLSVVEMRVLQDMTYEELAKTNDSRKFMLKMYECLIVRAPAFCSSITEIA